MPQRGARLALSWKGSGSRALGPKKTLSRVHSQSKETQRASQRSAREYVTCAGQRRHETHSWENPSTGAYARANKGIIYTSTRQVRNCHHLVVLPTCQPDSEEDGSNSLLSRHLEGKSKVEKQREAGTCLTARPPAKCMCVLSHLSHVQLFATPWTVAHPSPLTMGFSRQQYWSGLLCPPPGDLPDPGIEPRSLMSPALADAFFTTSTHLGSPPAQGSCLWALGGQWRGTGGHRRGGSLSQMRY